MANQQGKLQYRLKTETPSNKNQIIGAIKKVIDASNVDTRRVKAIGIGVPGLVESNGTLVFAPNLPHGQGLNFKDPIEEEFQKPCLINNDANCATYAEWQLGSGSRYSNFAMVTLGTGIGGGLVLNNQLFVGSLGFAGEVGHMVIDPYGPICPCGSRGCWERFASGSGLGRLARDEAYANKLNNLVELKGGDPENVKGEDVIFFAKQGDKDALKIVDDFAFWIAIGLANIAGILDLEAFVIGGGVVNNSNLWISPVRKKFATLVVGNKKRKLPRIVPSFFKEDSGAVGAALLAKDFI